VLNSEQLVWKQFGLLVHLAYELRRRWISPLQALQKILPLVSTITAAVATATAAPLSAAVRPR
jgi:hypothetical protein